MNNTTVTERKVGTKGFGSVMLDRLRTGPASTEELATLAGVTPQQAYSRLSFLQSQEDMLESVGKGTKKVWAFKGQSQELQNQAQTLSAHSDGPEHGHDAVDTSETALDIKKGDKLLVRYLESERAEAHVVVTRPADPDGTVLCWDLGLGSYLYVPTLHCRKYGMRVFKVSA